MCNNLKFVIDASWMLPQELVHFGLICALSTIHMQRPILHTCNMLVRHMKDSVSYIAVGAFSVYTPNRHRYTLTIYMHGLSW